MAWTLGDQSGKRYIITGANTGLGFETRALVHRSADVGLACRSEERGEAAVEQLMAASPGKSRFGYLDLADLDSVKAFGRASKKCDVLVNNAGVMVPPRGMANGFEAQFGVNFIGPFTLAIRMLTKFKRAVHLHSVAHKGGRIDFGNLRGEKPYKAWREYGQSKLADLIFAFELNRRLQGGKKQVSIACHPGVSKTELTRTSFAHRTAGALLGQSASQGALPTLRAATEGAGGDYIGPQGLGEWRGPPGPAQDAPQPLDEEVARRLWDVAAEATGVS